MSAKDFANLEPRFTDNADANKFLDEIKQLVNANSDAGMARKLNIQPPMICKIRKGHLAISSGLIVTIHEACRIEIAKLKSMAGMKHYKEQ